MSGPRGNMLPKMYLNDAASDLLEALKQALNRMEKVEKFKAGMLPVPPACEGAIELATAAIAKAEGRDR